MSGPTHPHTLTSVANFASLLKAQGRLKEAELLFKRAFDGMIAALGTEHDATIATGRALSNISAELASLCAAK